MHLGLFAVEDILFRKSLLKPLIHLLNHCQLQLTMTLGLLIGQKFRLYKTNLSLLRQ